MRNTWLVAVIGFYAIGCATSDGGPKPTTTAVPPASVSSSARAEADELRSELEAAYADLVTRAGSVAIKDAPLVDLEAAASIPIPQHRAIDSAVRLFSGRMKNSIQTSLIRSGRYRKLIDEALAAERLPKALAYLPVIESAYLPTLTSSAGAYGIWQFMPATGREYGLRVDWWVDERADPELSTRAAAAYLKDLHRMFGDWSLALAAYNCGPGRVRRTLASAGATTFWELLDQGLLPKETRGYVPTFYATIIIASDPEAYGFELGKVTDSEETTVTVRGPVSLAYIAEVIGADEKLLRELNPALRHAVVPPGSAAVRVPAKQAETLVARANTLREEDAYMKFAHYTLRNGDTVARLAKAIGEKPETILAMNDLRSATAARPGDALYLPVRARELGTLLSRSRDAEVLYAVRKGDTLYAIAKRNGVTVAELRELNDLERDAALRVGQQLRVTPPRTMTAGGM